MLPGLGLVLLKLWSSFFYKSYRFFYRLGNLRGPVFAGGLKLSESESVRITILANFLLNPESVRIWICHNCLKPEGVRIQGYEYGRDEIVRIPNVANFGSINWKVPESKGASIFQNL